ncbi:hypothetical protein [uncultured Tateyamaria sp.]|uniref:hypothetical protein n=1 Tax=uncultured Tateyamaria sp. TaxID=455651 RepID=UPI0026358A85|nr:hypothetical protein [uncultured Tateyamaria sp.]
MTTTAEIVTFRLKPDADAAAFVQAAQGLMPFLTGTGDMIARTLSVDEDGLWTDHITWTSRTAADAAAKAMFERPEAGPFMALIEPADMVMRHAVVHLHPD